MADEERTLHKAAWHKKDPKQEEQKYNNDSKASKTVKQTFAFNKAIDSPPGFIPLNLSEVQPFDFSKVTMLELLGEGGFGKVFKAYDKESGGFLAIKFYEKKNKKTFLEDILLEDGLLRCVEKVNSSLFLKYVGLFKNIQANSYLVVMESGVINLKEIMKARESYPFPKFCFIAARLAEQLALLEKNGIANRDVKTENVILVEDKDPKNGFIYKISDFGIGCVLPPGEKIISTDEFIGFTKKYAAPELIKITENTYDLDYYDPFLADVYSLALLMLDLLGLSKDAFKGKIKDKEIEELIENMLNQDPKKRPRFEKISKIMGTKKQAQPLISEKKYIEKFRELNEQNLTAEAKFRKHFENFKAYLGIYHLDLAEEFLSKCSSILSSNANGIAGTEMELKHRINYGMLNQKHNKGRLKQAIKWHEDALDLCEKLHGRKDQKYAEICVMLADDLYENDQYQDCEEFLLKAKNCYLIQPNLEKFGLQLELIARKLLSICCLSKFDFPKLISIVKEYIDVSEKFIRVDSDSFVGFLKIAIQFLESSNVQTITLKTLNTMIMIFDIKGSLRRYLRTYEKIGEEDDISIRIEFCKWNGFISILMNENDACEKALSKIIEFCIEYYGEKHILVANYYQRLGSFLWRMSKKNDEAEKNLKKSLSLKKIILQENEKELGDWNFEYAEFLKYGKKCDEEAEKYYEKALELLYENEETLNLIVESMSGEMNEETMVPRTICSIFK